MINSKIRAVIVKNTAVGATDLLIKISGLPGAVNSKFVAVDNLYNSKEYCKDKGITHYGDFYLSTHVGDDVTKYLKGVYYD